MDEFDLRVTVSKDGLGGEKYRWLWYVPGRWQAVELDIASRDPSTEDIVAAVRTARRAWEASAMVKKPETGSGGPYR